MPVVSVARGHEPLSEGWYLMSTSDLERELARVRDPRTQAGPSEAVRLSIDEALAYRNAGNLPDEKGRSLRLVLHVERPEDLSYLQEKRLLYEPDFHDAPKWRREGSKPVNVVPVHTGELPPRRAGPWWEEGDVAALDEEWRSTGRIAGIAVPSAYRSFVYKTVLALRSAGREVTADSVADSIARWVAPEDAERIRAALRAANR